MDRPILDTEHKQVLLPHVSQAKGWVETRVLGSNEKRGTPNIKHLKHKMSKQNGGSTNSLIICSIKMQLFLDTLLKWRRLGQPNANIDNLPMKNI